jgi:hypothetical protein
VKLVLEVVAEIPVGKEQGTGVARLIFQKELSVLEEHDQKTRQQNQKELN